MKGGLSNDDVRLSIYRQEIRPIVSYAFPACFDILSHQMEMLRLWEKHSVRCRSIYDMAQKDSVYVFMAFL